MTGPTLDVPLAVLPERVYRVYRGGRLLDAFRGEEDPADGPFPEDWVASDTRAVNPGRDHLREGLSTVVLPDGREMLLADLIRENPAALLGERHAARWGAHTALLVKLLDAAERLPVHWHPDRAFVAHHRGADFGKTECWLIMETRELGQGVPCIGLGLREDITIDAFRAAVATQDTDALIGALNWLPVHPGDVYAIPAGLPHAIGAGVMMVEVQEPSDWAIHGEYEAFGLKAEEAHQGFGRDAAFACLDAEPRSAAETVRLFKQEPLVVREVGPSIEWQLISDAYVGFFGARELMVRGELPMPGGHFSVGIVTGGSGVVETDRGSLGVARGDTFVIPAGADGWRAASAGQGALRIMLCDPPLPG